MKKLLPVVQSHSKYLTKTIDERIGRDMSVVVEGKLLSSYCNMNTC
jgi:hypothetical protein